VPADAEAARQQEVAEEALGVDFAAEGDVPEAPLAGAKTTLSMAARVAADRVALASWA
jgi:hypothetical protein